MHSQEFFIFFTIVKCLSKYFFFKSSKLMVLHTHSPSYRFPNFSLAIIAIYILIFKNPQIFLYYTEIFMGFKFNFLVISAISLAIWTQFTNCILPVTFTWCDVWPISHLKALALNLSIFSPKKKKKGCEKSLRKNCKYLLSSSLESISFYFSTVTPTHCKRQGSLYT